MRRVLPIAWVVVLLAGVPAARATFPGRNGLLAVPDNHIPYTIGIARVSPGGPAVDVSSRRTSFVFGCVINTGPMSLPCFGGRRAPNFAGRPSYSADGRRLVFDDGRHLDFVHANGTGFRKLAPLTSFDDHPSWFPDGRVVVFTGHPHGSPPTLFAVRPSGTGLRRLATRGDNASVSPSGRLIAFDRAGSHGRRDLWLMDANGSRQRRLAVNGSNPCFSPDGQELVFTSATPAGTTAIQVVGVSGSGRRTVAPQGTFAVFSPDGRLIAFTANEFFKPDEADLFVMPAGGGARTRRAFDDPVSEDSAEFGVPDWQPRTH